MPYQKQKFGDIGEREAEKFLAQKGFKVLGKNYRVKNLGEIDLIAEKQNKLYFFEVKTRNVKHETSFPIEFSIDERKRRNLKRICKIYMIEKHYSPDKQWQVDALLVKVDFTKNNSIIERLENILWEKYY